MAPPVSFAKTELGYPIFCAEFDPYNRGFLLAGGGGGENNAGIANKITLIDTQDRSLLTQAAEIDLSRQEDSVSSLASLATRDGLIAFTGIGSSIADKKNGKNDHFRTFYIKYPNRPKKNEKQKRGDITPGSRTCLFRPANATDRQTYQALIKLSPIKDRTSTSKRLGAIATGLAPAGEIVVFDATLANPDNKSVCARIALDRGVEPHDLDIFDQGDSSFTIAYCTDEGAYVYNLSYNFERRKAKCDDSPTTLYKIPKSTTGTGIAPPPRLKWLSSSLLMLLINKNPGVELVILQVGEAGQPAQVVLRKPLSKAIKSAVSLAVCPLDPDPATNERQLVLAIASGVSLHIFTMNHHPEYLDPRQQITNFSPFTSLDNVHPVSITRAVFSNFFPPMQPAGSNMSVASSPQYIQLASVTLSGSIVVETLALTSTPTSPFDTALADQSSINDKKTHHPNVRWVLSTPTSEFLRNWSGMALIAVMVLVSAILLRSYLDLSKEENVVADTWVRVFGSEPPFPLPRPEGGQNGPGKQSPGENKVVLSSHDESDTFKEAVDYVESVVEQAGPPAKVAGSAIRSLIDSVAEASAAASAEAETASYAVLVHPHDDHDDDDADAEASLGASTHHEASVDELRAAGAREFHELHETDKEKWRRRLARAGQWSRDEGEGVLKGILFSEYAGLVGGALRDAVVGG